MEVMVADLETKVFGSSYGEMSSPQGEIGKPILEGKYEILEKLGQGGMGTVYLGRHIHLERDVAIKFLAPQLEQDPQFRERFFHEAKTLAALDHPNIVKILDMGFEKDRYFFVMERVQGKALDEYLASHSLSIEEKLRILMEVAKGLEYAHEKGV
ncbi:MAG: serine/threonine protein kinase, partial [Planctomycetota bacterium]